MPDPWAHGYALDKQKNWEDVSNTIPVSLMGSAGCMISDMADIRTWIVAYVGGKVSKPATYKQLMNVIPTGDGNLAFGLAFGESAGWYGYTGGLPGYNTADYYFPAESHVRRCLGAAAGGPAATGRRQHDLPRYRQDRDAEQHPVPNDRRQIRTLAQRWKEQRCHPELVEGRSRVTPSVDEE